MRLFDKAMSEDPAFRALLSAPLPDEVSGPRGQECVVLNADEIARHFFTAGQSQWGPTDMPYATPPWGWCFVEWHEFLANNLLPSSAQTGALIYHTCDPVTVAKTRDHLTSMAAGDIEALRQIREIASLVSLRLVSFRPGFRRAGLLDVTQSWCLSSTGLILSISNSDSGYDEMLKLGPRRDVDNFLECIGCIVGLSFTFANCANVKLEDVTAQDAPPAKMRRRLKIPEVKRYTLNICGHSTRTKTSANIGQVGIMPWHLCRGHFATYTAERPLFGKYVGRYWREPHMRGKKERGEIVKDYDIKDSAQ